MTQHLRVTISDENYKDLEKMRDKMKVEKVGQVVEALIYYGRQTGFFDFSKERKIK